MRIFVPLTALLLATNVMAAPAAPGDDMNRFLSDKGLLGHIEQVRQTVTDKASEVRQSVSDKASEVRQSVSHTASDLVVNAMGFLGVPYKRGGNTAETGFDCSGFVRAMYEQTVGLMLPRKAEQQAAATEKIDKSDLKPGDLVFFNTMKRAFSHVGIYVGDGKFIHSPKPGSEVRVEDMTKTYWEHRFNGARRVSTASPATAALAAQVQLQQVQAAQPADATVR
jgi:cell wall-associated NlpC family hydrolase